MILYSLSVVYLLIIDYFNISKLLVQFPGQLRLFLVGIVLYILLDKFNKRNIYYYFIFSSLTLVLFTGNIYFKFIFYPLLLGIILLTLIYYVKQVKLNFDFSYSLYILHFPLIQLVLYFDLNPSNPFLSFISIFSILLLLAYLSEKFIEKIFIIMGKNLIKKGSKI